MSFSDQLKIIETLMFEDTERCIQLLVSKQFTENLFYQELKAFANILESVLLKKNSSIKANNQAKSILKPQIIVAMYSIIIMRSKIVNIKKEQVSNIATKSNLSQHNIYNVKLAVQTLSKLYKAIPQSDQNRSILCGLFLNIPSFNNYKMIIKDINPQYISQQTMHGHFDFMRNQCPNLFEQKLNQYKKQWSKYLRFKNIELKQLGQLIDDIINCKTIDNLNEYSKKVENIQHELNYLINRFSLLRQDGEIETVNIDNFINDIDEINIKISDKLKQTAINPKKSKIKQTINIQYDHQEFIHKNYQIIYVGFLKLINQSISGLGLNWIRKIKWLSNTVLNIFINFDVNGSILHQEIAHQYSNIFRLVLQIITNYFLTFKNGLFPENKLLQIIFMEEYSIYKLIEALLYNQYPFNEAEIIQYHNYQKQRKQNDQKNKQYLIDTVNFNMKSLNINIHWDTILIKIIPHLKNSIQFSKDILYQSLYLLHKYFETTNNYEEAPRLILMLANAKNTIFTSDRTISSIIKKIKQTTYPERADIKQGIENFCENYFKQYCKFSQKKLDEGQQRKKKMTNLGFCQVDSLNIHNLSQINANRIKKTQSYDSMFQGWQHFESAKDSVRDNSNSQLRDSRNRSHNMFQSVESVQNNQIFYSINESKNGNIAQQDKEKIQEQEVRKADEQILIPEF